MENSEIAVFGGGCFWCTEAVFSSLKGVNSVMPGYAGGHTTNPSYREVCSETTGHAEVIRIDYNPSQISYDQLLEVFFEAHDPTTLNRQGADVGTSYRSLILYSNESQKDLGPEYIAKLDASGVKDHPIVTQSKELTTFYDAEPEHMEYYDRNPGNMYCQIVIRPKLEKVKGEFQQLLS